MEFDQHYFFVSLLLHVDGKLVETIQGGIYGMDADPESGIRNLTERYRRELYIKYSKSKIDIVVSKTSKVTQAEYEETFGKSF